MEKADPFTTLRNNTRARVALGRVGDAIPTKAMLELQMAHAMAKDAVHGRVNFNDVANDLIDIDAIELKSAAIDRGVYLRRPDLGRRLAEGEANKLEFGEYDVAFVIADGLSAFAMQKYSANVVNETIPLLNGLKIAPVVLVNQGRVAIGDEIAQGLGAKIVIILIGERPGLSSAESLGAYITYGASVGTPDSARNCISNIHNHGLLPIDAAKKIAWIVNEALKIGLTGIGLKEAYPTNYIDSDADTVQIK